MTPAEEGKPGFQPSNIVFKTKTQAVGLGWYNGTPSAIIFGVTRGSRKGKAWSSGDAAKTP